MSYLCHMRVLHSYVTATVNVDSRMRLALATRAPPHYGKACNDAAPHVTCGVRAGHANLAPCLPSKLHTHNATRMEPSSTNPKTHDTLPLPAPHTHPGTALNPEPSSSLHVRHTSVRTAHKPGVRTTHWIEASCTLRHVRSLPSTSHRKHRHRALPWHARPAAPLHRVVVTQHLMHTCPVACGRSRTTNLPHQPTHCGATTRRPSKPTPVHSSLKCVTAAKRK